MIGKHKTIECPYCHKIVTVNWTGKLRTHGFVKIVFMSGSVMNGQCRGSSVWINQ